MSSVFPLTPAGELAAAIAALHQHLRAGAARDEIFDRLVHLAVAGVPGCDWAGLTSWPINQLPHTVAATGDTVGQVDDLQCETGEGPCLSAVLDDAPAVLADTGQPGSRWPAFAAAVHVQFPVRGVLAFPIGDDTDRMAVDFYTTTPDWFDPVLGSTAAVDLAGQFAAHARGLLLHAATSHKNSHLQSALTTSREIGAAIGILMNTYKLTTDNAFALLRRVSQERNRKLREIAGTIITTGQLPDAAVTGTGEAS